MVETHPHVPFTRAHWLGKLRTSLLAGGALIAAALGLGMLGYHYLGALRWVDSFLEASMILGGMGPVNPLANDSVKIFAACYALVSGLALISITGVLLAPWVQRLMYHTHRQARRDAEIEDNGEQ